MYNRSIIIWLCFVLISTCANNMVEFFVVNLPKKRDYRQKQVQSQSDLVFYELGLYNPKL